MNNEIENQLLYLFHPHINKPTPASVIQAEINEDTKYTLAKVAEARRLVIKLKKKQAR